MELLIFFINLKTNKRSVFVNAITSERVRWIGELKELLSEYLSIISYYDDKPVYEGEERAKYFERILYLQNKIKLHLNYRDERDKEIIELIEKINSKIFDIYDAKKFIEIPKEKRFDALSDEQKQKYFDKIISEQMDKEANKKFLIIYGSNALNEILNKVIEVINKDFVKQYGFEASDKLIHMTNLLVDKSRIYLKEEWERVKEEAEKGRLNSKKKKSVPEMVRFFFFPKQLKYRRMIKMIIETISIEKINLVPYNPRIDLRPKIRNMKNLSVLYKNSDMSNRLYGTGAPGTSLEGINV